MTWTPIGRLPSVAPDRDGDDRQADERDRLGEHANVRPEQCLLTAEEECLFAYFRRLTRGGRGEQHVDVAEELKRARVKGAAEFLRLGDPGPRQHRSGNQAVAHFRIEVPGPSLEALEMKSGAFDHGDEIGRRPRPRCVGKLNHAIGLEGARHLIDRREGGGIGILGEEPAQFGDAHVRDAGVQRRPHGLGWMSACAGSFPSLPSIAS